MKAVLGAAHSHPKTACLVIGACDRIDLAAAVSSHAWAEATMAGTDASGRLKRDCPRFRWCVGGGTIRFMNMNVLALMLTIGGVFFGLTGYALIEGRPLLLIALAAIAGLAFAPWHRWR